MDDLSGLDWSASSSAKPKSSTNGSSAKPSMVASSSAFSYPSLHPTPSPLGSSSGRNTPLSTQGSGMSGGVGGGTARSVPLGGVGSAGNTGSKSAQDSFSGLLANFGSGAKNTANMSLRERQELLEAEKRKKEEERRRQQEANYGNGGQFLDALARGAAGVSRTASPAVSVGLQAPSPGSGAGSGADDDIFAAFNANTKVDNASFFPPSTSPDSRKSTPAPPGLNLADPSAWNTGGHAGAGVPEDDDPFGLGQFQSRPAAAPSTSQMDKGDDDDDDFLGALGRPVEEFRRKAEEEQKQQQQQQQQQQKRRAGPGQYIADSSSSSDGVDDDGNTVPARGAGKTGNDAFDKAVAQLMDYGFTAENAQRGLTESGAGLNVQAAVNWLLDDAHRQAKEAARAKNGGEDGGGSSGGGRGGREGRGGRGGHGDSRDAYPPSSRSPGGDADFAKTAAAVGTTFLKTANSLWKTGQKKVQKAVQEFQQETDPSQPRWMQQSRHDEGGFADGHESGSQRRETAAATNEAMLLEMGGRPDRKPSQRPSQPQPPPQQRPPLEQSPRLRQDRESVLSSQPPSRTQSPASVPSSRNSPVPRWQQQQDPRSRLIKKVIEQESTQAYVSPARRRKTATPSPAPTPPPPQSRSGPPEGDLLSNSTALPQRPAPSSLGGLGALASGNSSARPSPRPTPSPRPAAATPRSVPSVSAAVLRASAQQRIAGAAHVKRGDYAAAHEAYSASLAGMPATHPLMAVLFCNRALTSLKTGEPRQAVADADAALAVIGPGRGEGESVALEDGSGNSMNQAETRDLKDLYGKALARKAEALEQMEKWAEAGVVWQQCVEAGVGGGTALAGRQRCQSALAPKPKSESRPKPRPRPAAPAARSATNNGRDSEAVQRLRAANEASEREDADKLALLDHVDARIGKWRDGKKDNLRALLGSLDVVLWEGSGWKKVGLHELVMANKVKIAYMRAIAKTHPDKLPQDASTEVRMIAGTVFSTLNESWDKFKADNKM